MIGMDSSAIIDLFRNDSFLVKILEDMDEEIVLNQMSFYELMIGLDFDNLIHKKEENFYDELFEDYKNLSLDKNSSKKASKISFELKKDGKIIGDFDCIIAGIYLTNGVNKIITRNVKHFERIKGMKVIGY